MSDSMNKYHLFAGQCYYATSDDFVESFETLADAIARWEALQNPKSNLDMAVDWCRVYEQVETGLILVYGRYMSHNGEESNGDIG